MKHLPKYMLALLLVASLSGCGEKEAASGKVGTSTAPAPKEQGAVGTVPGKEIAAPAAQTTAPQSRGGDTSFKE